MRIRWNNTGRTAGFLLSLVLLLELGPSGVQAQSGAVEVIGSAEDLLAFAQSVNEGESYAGRTVTLTADIDMAGRVFAPIGRPESGLSHVFQGVFNGGGHTISGLVLSGDGMESAGLFAELHNAVVRDLSLDAVVAANGPGAVGALAGWMVNGTVRNVHVSAYVTAAGWGVPEDGSAAVGIVAGKATGRTVMDHVAAQGSAAGAGADRWAVYVGGLIGYIQGGGSIANCYTTASVFCNDAGVYVGGFFGGAVSPPAVSDSYTASLVIGGRATSGAFAGYYEGEQGGVFNVWYDRDLAGALAGVGVPGDSPLNDALLPETTAVMRGGGFPSRLGSAFAQAGPGQNQGYPVFSQDAPHLEPSASPEPSPEPSATPEPSPEPSPTPEPSPEPSASPEPSPEPSATPEPSPVPSASPEPSPEPSASPEPSPEPSATPEPSPEPSASPEPSPEPSASPEPSPEPSASPEPSPEPSATPEPSPGPSSTPGPSPEPSATPEPSPEPSATPEPSPEPSATPEPSPEPSPTPEPSPEPSASPEPSPEPSATPEPSPEPSASPEPSPEPSPTPEPSPEPSASPEPSPEPSATPEPSPEPSATPEPSPESSITPGPFPEPSASPGPSPEPFVVLETESPTSSPIYPILETETPTTSPTTAISEKASPTEASAVPTNVPPVPQRDPFPQPDAPPGPPRTGDGADAMFWMAALVLCSIGLAYAVMKRRGPF